MGNWHCIPSSCATVHYREYQGAKIRWRYGSEPWQEIEGDDYLVKQETGKCYGVSYRIGGNALEMPRPSFGKSCENPTTWELASNFLGKIVSVSFYFAINQPIQAYVTRENTNGISSSTWNYLYWTTGSRAGTSAYMYYAPTCSESNHVFAVSGVNKWQARRVDNQSDNCGDCTFTVTKNGQTIYAETRAVCPEVQKIPCQLSAVNKQIEIEKLPYLERVEIRDQSINTVFVSPLEAPLLDTKPLPSNCYNVYKTYILAPPLLSNFVPLPGVVNPYQFIAQICSSVGCPPPEYQVICDCNNCQSCPDGTCPIECDGQICCYNDYGVSVAQIPLVDYCGGNS